jgi:gephyrin
MDHLRAYSFISLCHHLRSHSNLVSNIDLMSISGFCRNCLAKWLVLHARTLSNQIMTMSSSYPAVSNSQQQQLVESLNMFDYDMAAQYVYGCTYITWKERYQTKATDAQLEKYNNSKPIHAIHDDNLLAPIRHHHGLAQSTSSNNKVQACSINAAASSRPVVNSLLLSDVCCQDVESLVAVHGSSSIAVPSPQGLTSSTNTIPLLKPPKGGYDIILKVGILTVSDRASNNTYETGDLSGPAVENTIIGLVNQMNKEDQQQQNSIIIEHIEKSIVPDDIESIKDVLLCWSGKKSTRDDDELPSSPSYYDLVLTTGGTGFSSRDVTPEATNQILDRQCLGLMSWASMELTNLQPLATLSRASAGTCRDTLIVNLPGNPAGAAQVVELLFPLLLYAIKDLQSHK